MAKKKKTGQRGKKIPWQVLAAGIVIAVAAMLLIWKTVFDRPPKEIQLSQVMSFGQAGKGRGELLQPRAIAIGADGRIAVSDTGNRRVQVFDPQGAPLAELRRKDAPEGFQEPSGVAVLTDGTVAVLDPPAGVCAQFVLRGKGYAAGRTIRIRDSYFPRGLSYSSSQGNLIVADTGRGQVVRMNTAGEVASRWGSVGRGKGQMSDPWAAVADRDGTIYVADTGNKRLLKFSRQGKQLAVWKVRRPEMNPSSLAIDTERGLLIAGDAHNNCLWFFRTDGRLLGFARGSRGGDELKEPRGVAVDPQGGIWVVSSGSSRIIRYAPLDPGKTR